uniref:Putative GDSL family lipase n=1 Tax=uncultured bacterium Lq_007_G03 TaxID=1489288 RepID=A0A0B4N1I3_9BACT|nr:putative GDSL family lipase [uncultured bacterium Lq_007_G03]
MQRIALPDPRFLPLGRHDPKEERTSLWWSGSGVRVKLACKTLEAEITASARDHAPWIGVLMDGAPVARFPLLPGAHRYPLLAGLDECFAHEVSVIRDSQPSYDEDGPIYLDAVYTDGEPHRPVERPLLLEFIGDSLTVGEGCLGPESAEEWRLVWISHMPAFPTLVSQKLNAEKRVIALGGWGAARSWDNQPESRIGRIYNQLCAITPGGDRPADFPERPADAVVINLGTNDASALAKMTEAERSAAEGELRVRAVELMKMARAHNPKAVILWAYGLCGKQVEPMLQAAVQDRRNAGDQNVHYLSLTPAASNGSRMHPSREAHQKATEEIAEVLKNLLP